MEEIYSHVYPTNFCHRLSESRGDLDPVYFITTALRMAVGGIDFFPAAFTQQSIARLFDINYFSFFSNYIYLDFIELLFWN
ncbi:hypothetical protein MmiHf6_17150 [Methanimicrococcus hongohii]|uniref:Uncharacterized protein n=1 Tax=Methanimicrococcus hongohii TaxID=3028295 RepID=A0AA96V0X7_9EURY|nr:hypothetical protein [Methanimicrococcus sp. Hf6]WNY24384.1 hypothetical protein MmiHf6_17150 [Methanimicrococcus sp. Hf6]